MTITEWWIELINMVGDASVSSTSSLSSPTLFLIYLYSSSFTLPTWPLHSPLFLLVWFIYIILLAVLYPALRPTLSSSTGPTWLLLPLMGHYVSTCVRCNVSWGQTCALISLDLADICFIYFSSARNHLFTITISIAISVSSKASVTSWGLIPSLPGQDWLNFKLPMNNDDKTHVFEGRLAPWTMLERLNHWIRFNANHRYVSSW